MNAEDGSTSDRLASVMLADKAVAGPPPAGQLAALRQAVAARQWRWVPLQARLPSVLIVIAVLALALLAAASLFLVQPRSARHGRPTAHGPTPSATPGPSVAPGAPRSPLAAASAPVT